MFIFVRRRGGSAGSTMTTCSSGTCAPTRVSSVRLPSSTRRPARSSAPSTCTPISGCSSTQRYSVLYDLMEFGVPLCQLKFILLGVKPRKMLNGIIVLNGVLSQLFSRKKEIANRGSDRILGSAHNKYADTKQTALFDIGNRVFVQIKLITLDESERENDIASSGWALRKPCCSSHRTAAKIKEKFQFRSVYIEPFKRNSA